MSEWKQEWWKPQRQSPPPTPSSELYQGPTSPRPTSTPTPQEWFSNPETFKRNTFLKFQLSQRAYDKVRNVPVNFEKQPEGVGGQYGDGSISLGSANESHMLHELGHASDNGALSDHPTMKSFVDYLTDNPYSEIAQTALGGFQNYPEYKDYAWDKGEIVARLIADYPVRGFSYPQEIKELIGSVYNPTTPNNAAIGPNPITQSAPMPWDARPTPQPPYTYLAPDNQPVSRDIPHGKIIPPMGQWRPIPSEAWDSNGQVPWNNILRYQLWSNQTRSRSK